MRELIRHILREHTQKLTEAKRFVTYEMNDDSFARVFHLFLNELKVNEGFSHSKMKYAFNRTIRMWTLKPPEIISKNVLDYFIINHPNINPFKVNHRPRNKYGIDLIFEHTTPISTLLKQLEQSETLEQVKSAMNNYSGLCIISKEEDKCLERGGYSRKRPQGWRQAYDSCGIEVMDENQYNTYKQEKLNP